MIKKPGSLAPSCNIGSLHILIFVILLLIIPINQSLAGKYNFERFEGKEGLYKRTITCGLQDQVGFLWFGSEDGLLRYDGYEFKEFVYDPDDHNSLSSNIIYALLEDHHGMLWIGTVGGGLNRYNPKTGIFKRYLHDPENVNSLSHNGVISLLEDSKGRIWIGTEGGGLNRLDPDTETFTRYTHNPENVNSISFDSMWHLFEDPSGRIWIGTHGGGLNVLNPDNGTFKTYRHNAADETTISSDIVGPIFIDSKNNMWVGGINGLNFFDRQQGTFQRFIHDSENPASIGHNHVWDITEDDSGDLWIGSFGGGISRLDVDNKIFTSITHSQQDLRSLSSDLVWCVFQSEDGVMWVGTDGGGLNKFVKRTLAFNHYTAGAQNGGSLAYNGVNGIAESKSGILWMANDGGGIQSFNPENGKSQLFKYEPANPNSLNSNLTETILVDHSGIIWIGTYNGGLNAYNPQTQTFSHYINSADDLNSLSDNRVWSLYEDSKTNLWVGTRNGLNRLDPERSNFKRFMENPLDSKSLSDNGIWVTFEDSNGSIWVGTDNGLNRMVDDNHFEKFYNDSNLPYSLSHNTTTSIFESREGTLWVGTNGGLNRLNKGTDQFTRFTVKDGLTSNSIRGIMEDEKGQLWITTVKGLTRFSPEDNGFHTYQARDGLQGSEFSRAHYKRSDGAMVIGGRNGINLFNPEEIENNQHLPPVVFTSFSTFNKELSPGARINPQKVIQLGYRDTTVTFNFAGLDYNNPAANIYTYKLEGFENEWVEAGNRHQATYTNLGGGEYIFRVKATNNHGLWNSEGNALHLFIDLSPWKRWWAYMIYGLVLLATLMSFIELRAKRDKERIASVEGMNRKLASEVEERKKVEDALILSEQRLLMALEAAQEAMWEFSPLTGAAYFSRTWFTMLGYEEDEFLHNYETWSKLIHSDDVSKVEGHLNRYLNGKEHVYHIEFRMLAKNGEWKWILATGKVLERDKLGNPEKMSGIHMDITSRKNTEIEKQRLEVALQHASKMEAIGTLAGGVAHDFNNILSAMVGYSELGLLEVEKGTSVHTKFERMLQASYRARDLVQQILTFSRKDHKKLQPIQMGPIVKEALQLIRSTLPVTISIKSDLQQDMRYILADPSQVHQIIVNLCTNAAHSMEEEGGLLSVTLREIVKRQEDLSGQVPLKSGLYAELMIIDTGEGIEEEHIADIFNPYFTTKKQGKGSSLGLSVVLGIIQSCGGTISVESTPGEGTTFIVLLPMVEPKKIKTDKISKDTLVQSKPCRVLLIDDEEPIIDILSQFLKDMGNGVVAFQDAVTAVEYFRKNPAEFDVVITDMTMPSMTGDKVARQVKNLRPDIPIILCTGYSNRALDKNLKELGGDALLMKPVERDKLIQTINAVI